MENNKDIYFAPVLIPTLCRSKHFLRLMESLKRNTWAKYTDVYCGLDYPPSEKYRQGWQEICDYVDNGDFSCFAKFVVFKRTVQATRSIRQAQNKRRRKFLRRKNSQNSLLTVHCPLLIGFSHG